ncbi:hypothetical protein [Streptomyces sp. NPDC002265]|uniref:hypothetical protein n=1 Tax=Streptomyces sp. NPDC002265 TaxID=3154415 RepID=UPI0033216431
MPTLSKRLLYIGGTVSAVTAVLALGAAPASAGDGTVKTKKTSTYAPAAGSMNFTAYGDIFAVCDNDSDAAGVRGYWKVGSGGAVHSFYNGNGRGNCVESDQDVSETAYVYIDVCIQDDGVVQDSTCSGWEEFYAGNG